ncbi:MAG: hypothetical protein IPN55_08325 [Saprospiraceae bacterium]|nr:hypothetical protein [Candidatus Brachybacter algidus]
MKDTFFGIALFVLSCIFISCKNHENVATEIPKVTLSEGLYVNQSLLEMIVDTTLLWDIRRLGEQITILKGDTIEVDNFIEKGRFHFSYTNDSVISIDPLLYGAKFSFQIKSATELHLNDTLNYKNGEPQSFVKSDKSFMQLLNEKLVAGNYADDKSKVKNTIILGSDGSIKNWNYTGYELCIAGDCAEMPAFPANVILLKTTDGLEFMVYKVEKKTAGRYLTLYKLEAGSPDEKGNMALTGDSVVLKNIY